MTILAAKRVVTMMTAKKVATMMTPKKVVRMMTAKKVVTTAIMEVVTAKLRLTEPAMIVTAVAMVVKGLVEEEGQRR